MQNKTLRRWTYAAGFFAEMSLAIVAYISSSFLATLIGEEKVGFIYSLASGLSLILLSLAPWLLRRGNWRRLLSFSILGSLLAAIILATDSNKLNLLAAFVVFSAFGLLTKYSLDIQLEALSFDHRTGKIRGLFLTIINTAWLLAPFLAGWLSQDNNYSRAYSASFVILVPLFLLNWFVFAPERRSEFPLRSKSFFMPWPSSPTTRKNIILVIILDFLLNCFYAIMIIYTPIYLHRYIGFDWITIGKMFTIMLTPFVILDYPLGQIADRWLGEKEIMTFGLLVMALALTLIPFIKTAHFFLWAGILFLSRVGAASFEVMKESFLFKQIDARHSHILSFSRNTYPLAYLIGPLAAVAIIETFPFSTLFTFLALVVSLGLFPILFLTDTK